MLHLAGVSLLGAALVGCASSGGSTPVHHHAGAPAPSIVYASDALSRWEREAAPPESARFEFARNDDALGARALVALRASDQWPQPLRPIERPVNFRLYRQDVGGFSAGFDRRGFDGRSEYNGPYRRDAGDYDGRYGPRP